METPDRFYDAALLCITLIGEDCAATLDPEEDLGEHVNFHTNDWFVTLGDEAYRRGWSIDWGGDRIQAKCPDCTKKINVKAK